MKVTIQLKMVVEALLMASPDPLSAAKLAEVIRQVLNEEREEAEDAEWPELARLREDMATGANVDEALVGQAIRELIQDYDAGQRAFTLLEGARGWQVHTRGAFGVFINQLIPGEQVRKLTPPAMETLAIVAYRQPVTKAALEAVRGVSCDGMLQKLMDWELVEVYGRSELPGRPLLYQTSEFFFEFFGLRSLDDLPNVEELRVVSLPEPPDEAGEDEAPQEMNGDGAQGPS